MHRFGKSNVAKIVGFFYLLTFFTLFSGVVPPCAHAAESEKISLQLKWFHAFQFAGYYAAKEKGFFAEEGLEVDIVERDPSRSYIGDVLDGKAQYGVADSGLLLPALEGAPVVLVAQIFQHSPLVFLTRKDSDLRTPFDLRDKRVMFDPVGTSDAPLSALIVETLGSLERVQIVDQTFRTEDLVERRVDAMLAYVTDQPFWYGRHGVAVNIIDPRDYGVDFYGDNLFTTRDEIMRHPARVEKVKRAVLKGWAYALAHPDEIVDVILAKYNTQNMSREHLLYEARQTAKMILPNLIELGAFKRSRFTKQLEIYAYLGMTKGRDFPEHFFYEKKAPVLAVDLTPQEQAWLDRNHVVRARVGNAEPLHFHDGEFRGLAVDYLKLLARRVGFKVEFVADIPWSKALDEIKHHENIDLILTAKRTPERETSMLFTQDYILAPWLIFAREGGGVRSLMDLRGKTVAVEKGYVIRKKLAAEYPDIKLITTDSTKHALEAVATYQADAYIGNILTGLYTIQKNNFMNVKLVGAAGLGDHNQAMAVRKDWPELVGIIDKAFKTITPQEHATLKAKWLSSASKHEETLPLTREESEWLAAHPVLRVHNEMDWPPHNFNVNGKPKGYSIALMNLIAKKLGVEVEYISGPSWAEFLRMTKQGDIDVMLNIVETPERLKYLEFTEPYITMPTVIITEDDHPPVMNLEQLANQTVAIPKGFYYQEHLERDYPSIKLLLLDNQLDSLKAVATGRADASLGGVGVLSYIIRQYSLINLKLNSTVDDEHFDMVLRIAAPKHDGVLRSILQKAMDQVTAEEQSRIYTRWIGSIQMMKEDPEATDAMDGRAPSLLGNVWFLLLAVFLLFLGVFLLLKFGMQAASEENLTHGISSRLTRNVILASLCLVVIIVAGLSWVALDLNKQHTTQNMATNLRTVHASVQERLVSWAEQYKNITRNIAESSELVEITRRLRVAPPTREGLLTSWALKDARKLFYDRKALAESLGFFIINKDYINIGARRDTNLGKKNLIEEQRPDLMRRVFRGETVFAPPMRSDVVLRKDAANSIEPTMFFLAPIMDEEGDILAALAIRVDAHGAFSQILQSGRIGASGESYAFDKSGILISQSRFEHDLRRHGLLETGASSILNVPILDPGVNLLERDGPPAELHSQPLTKMAANAIQGKPGANFDGYRDYRGVPVIGVWSWSKNLGLGLATEIDLKEAFSTYNTLRLTVLIIMGVSLLLTVGATLFSLLLGERTSSALIKARDELEDRVAERTSRLRSIIDTAQDAIVLIDAQGVIQEFSPAAELIFGFSRDEVMGENVTALMPEEYRAKHLHGFHTYLDSQVKKIIGKRVEVAGRRKNGEVFPLDLSVAEAIVGEERFFTGIIRDITEQKAAEETLLFTQTAVDQAAVAVFWIAPEDGRFEYVNDKAVSMLGYDKEKLLQYKVSNLDPNFPEKEWPHFIAELQQSGSRNFESVLEAKNGREIPVEISLYLTEYASQEKLVAFVTDITVRQEAEKEVLKLSKAVENISTAVIITDPNGKIEYVNPYFEDMTGFSKEEAIGKNPRILKSNVNPMHVYEDMWGTITMGVPWRGELINRRKDGREIWNSVSIVPLFNNVGQIVHYVSLQEDVTERKQMEKELIKAKNTAEAATQVKSDFLANMSHEIRTPMNAVIGLSTLALQTDLTRRQHDYVNKIHTAGNTLLGIINDILDFSKIEAGKMSIERAPFSLEEVLENVTSLNALKTREKGLDLLISFDPAIPDNLVGDALRLGQVLTNLTNNAIKFTEEGEILIKTELVVDEPEQAAIQFTVSDTGIGMNEEQVGRLFKAFSQADTSTTRKYGGTGLGLIICKRLVEMMGGAIWVDSAQGKGSSFFFTATFQRTEQSEAPGSRYVVPEEVRHVRALVVDDSPNSREIMLNLLGAFGMETVAVDSGERAVNTLESATPGENDIDLVLMDHHMPGMDGLETIRRIREHPNMASQPKFLLVTNEDDAPLHRSIETLQVGGRLLKPVTPSSLYDALLCVLTGKCDMEGVPRVSVKGLGQELVQGIRGARILVAEDNVVNQQIAKELLEGAQLEALIAQDGQEAVDMVAQELPDAVLMDIQMPRLDGYEATRAIREDARFQTLPIIAITANVMAGDKEKALSEGMNDHVAKPIDPKELFAALAKWVEPGEREIPEHLRERDMQTTEPAPSLNLPGFDVQGALARMGNNAKAYQKTLGKFLESEADAMLRLRERLEDGDREAGVRIAHTMKGVAGNIGAAKLQRAAAELERVLKESASPAAHIMKECEQALERTFSVIRSALESVEEKHTTAPLDKGEISRTLETLREQIHNFDSTASETFDQVAEKLHDSAFESTANSLAAALDGYDFDKALELLNALFQALGGEGEG